MVFYLKLILHLNRPLMFLALFDLQKSLMGTISATTQFNWVIIHAETLDKSLSFNCSNSSIKVDGFTSTGTGISPAFLAAEAVASIV